MDKEKIAAYEVCPRCDGVVSPAYWTAAAGYHQPRHIDIPGEPVECPQ
ncbi:hypothetical protein [Streptomyces sp. C10-9-1]